MTTELEAGLSVTRHIVEHEHSELAAGVAGIEEAAAGSEPVALRGLPHRVRVILDWFDRRLAEHLAWEDAWLYPQLDRLAGTPWVGRLMRFEHGQIRGAFGRLEAEWASLELSPDPARVAALRGRLYGLACVIRGHLEREEWLLTPLLQP